MKSGVLGDALGKVGGLAQQVGQTVAQAPKEIVKTTAKQIGFEVQEGEKKKETVEALAKNMQGGQKDQANEQFVKELYGASKSSETPANLPKEVQQAQTPKSLEEQQKMQGLRQQLHGEYYQKLTTPIKRQEEAQKEQERASERVERLEMQDLQKKQEDDKKKKPIAVTNAANKTESQPGAG